MSLCQGWVESSSPVPGSSSLCSFCPCSVLPGSPSHHDPRTRGLVDGAARAQALLGKARLLLLPGQASILEGGFCGIGLFSPNSQAQVRLHLGSPSRMFFQNFLFTFIPA